MGVRPMLAVYAIIASICVSVLLQIGYARFFVVHHHHYPIYAYMEEGGLLLVYDALILTGIGFWMSWAVQRRQHKLGIMTTAIFPALWHIRYGAWVGMISTLALKLILSPLVIGVFLLAPSLVQSADDGVFIVSLIYGFRAVAYYYNIPPTAFVRGYSVYPVLIMIMLGVFLTIIVGQYVAYEKAGITNATHKKTVITDGVTTKLTPLAFYKKDIMETVGVHHPNQASRLIRIDRLTNANLFCKGGPFTLLWQHTVFPATVIGPAKPQAWKRNVIASEKNLHGFADMKYFADRHVLIHPDSEIGHETQYAAIPFSSQIPVVPGEHVQVESYHASHHVACSFVPNLVVNPYQSILSGYGDHIGNAVVTKMQSGALNRGWGHYGGTIEIRLTKQGQVMGTPVFLSGSPDIMFRTAVISAVQEIGVFPPPKDLPYSWYHVVKIWFIVHHLHE